MAALLVAAAAGPATAAELRVEDGVLRYIAGAGEQNELELFSDDAIDGLVHVYEYGATITPGLGCFASPDPVALPEVRLTFHCPGVQSADVELGDEQDALGVFTVPQAVTASGGTGGDLLAGSAGADVLAGGAGDDRIIARSPCAHPRVGRSVLPNPRHGLLCGQDQPTSAVLRTSWPASGRSRLRLLQG